MNGYTLSTYLLRDTPLAEARALLAASGFDAIELSGTGSALLTAWERDPSGMTGMLSEDGLRVPSIHCTTEGRRGLDSMGRIARELDRTGFAGIRTVELKPLPAPVAPRMAQAAAAHDGWMQRVPMRTTE